MSEWQWTRGCDHDDDSVYIHFAKRRQQTKINIPTQGISISVCFMHYVCTYVVIIIITKMKFLKNTNVCLYSLHKRFFMCAILKMSLLKPVVRA